MVDLLQPLSSNNRTEDILIEYEGFINSLSERLLLLMEMQDDSIKKYPKLNDVFEMSNDNIFNLANLYTLSDLNKTFFNNDLSDEMIDSLFDTSIIEFQRKTLFEYSMYNLIQEKYVRSISIIKRTEFKDYELEMLATSFDEYFDKIQLYTGDTFSLVKDKKFTTICMNDFVEMNKIITSMDIEYIQDIFFILRNNSSNMTIEDDGNIVLRYTDDINNIIMNKGIFISRAFSNCLEEDGLEILDDETCMG